MPIRRTGFLAAPLLLAAVILAQPGAIAQPVSQTRTIPPAEASTNDLVSRLFQGIQTQRQAPLGRSPVLDQVAAAEALRLAQSGGAQPDGAAVHADLVRNRYIPMLDTTIFARSAADPDQALAVLQSDLLTAFPLSDTAYTEIGLASEPNSRAKGPNEEIIWVLVLAKPLNAPVEDPNSPRALPR